MEDWNDVEDCDCDYHDEFHDRDHNDHCDHSDHYGHYDHNDHDGHNHDDNCCHDQNCHVPRPDIPVYHPDVKAYEVREIDSEGRDVLVAFFLHDLFARPYKQSGAWMSAYRDTYRGSDGARVVPIVVNNCNFTKGSPTLLSYDDAITLFHVRGAVCTCTLVQSSTVHAPTPFIAFV